MKYFLIVLAAFVAFGCSSPDSDKRSADTPGASEGDAKLREQWKWGGDDATRDVETDDAACRAQSDPDAPPLGQVAQYGSCMLQKGWVLKDPGGN